MIRFSTIYYTIALLGITLQGFAQQTAIIRGTVSDENGKALFSTAVAIEGTVYGTVTDADGTFSLEVPANQELILAINYLGYKTIRDTLSLTPGQIYVLSKVLIPEVKQLDDVEVLGIRSRENTLIPINIKSIDQLPNASQNIEAIIKTLPGVGSGNELY